MELTQHKNSYVNRVVGIISKLNNSRLECDGLTRVASALLNHASIEHDIYSGYPCSIADNNQGPYHLWIALSDSWNIDFRIRNWVGGKKTAPHGLYYKPDYQKVFYFNRKERMPKTTISNGMLSMLTDGLYDELAQEITGLKVLYS